MTKKTPERFTAPLLLGVAFLLVAMAIVEKGLNLIGMGIPLIHVFPRQILDWAVAMAILEIALTLRIMLERSLAQDRAG